MCDDEKTRLNPSNGMSAEEALHYFRNRLATQCGKDTTQRRAFEVAIEALEKQIPRKYTMQRVDNIFGAVYRRVCPACRDRITISEDSIPFEFYCRKCGVRLVLDTTEDSE